MRCSLPKRRQFFVHKLVLLRTFKMFLGNPLLQFFVVEKQCQLKSIDDILLPYNLCKSVFFAHTD